MNARSVVYVIVVTVLFLGLNFFFSYQHDQKNRKTLDKQEIAHVAQEVKEPPSQVVFANLGEQNYYVLENSTVQLVFTDVGGALCEINLPFASKKDSDSVVNEIEFDKQIVQQSPQNAHFPAHPYYLAGNLAAKNEGKLGGYYPLLRRGIDPKYYATNITSDYPELAQLSYRVTQFTNESIVFTATQQNRKITKTYHLSPKGAPYCFDLSIDVEGDTRGLWIGTGIMEVEIMSNSSSPLLQYRVAHKGSAEVDKLHLPKVGEMASSNSIRPLWVCDSNGYMGVLLDPLTDIPAGYRATATAGIDVPTRLTLIDAKYQPYAAKKYPGYEFFLPLPAKPGTTSFRVYAGPFEEQTLKLVDKIFTTAEGGNPSYASARSFHGFFSFIARPFAKLLFVVMQFFHYLTHSWGFSIILLTLFLRVLLYPLNAWSIKSMRRMQKISPQIQALQKKYKKDQKRMQMEIMTLYREKKVNPFLGCVPILIQLPFLIAMFDLLKSSFQLRGASFIPGWIENLTAPDVLFSWSTPIFFFGTQFHLLPFLLGAVMFVQQRIGMAKLPKNPEELTDQQRQQKAMGTIMTVVFTVMFYNFPSGLNLYWLSSMVLGILQQWFMNKILDKKDEKPEIISHNMKK